MPTITKENARDYCRSCLQLLTKVTETSGCENMSAEFLEDVKDILINVTTNAELQRLIAKYVDGKLYDQVDGFPQNICLDCFDGFQKCEKFLRRAKESADNLYAVMRGEVSKLEIEYDKDEIEYNEEEQHSPQQHSNNEDIYKLLLKDTLMETESVLLDSSAVETLASIEMQDPDPIDSMTPDAPVSDSDLPSGDDDNDDWQVNALEDNSTSSSSHSSWSMGSAEASNKNDAQADAAATEALTTRLRSGKDTADDIEHKGKKKRRTKKEMEEFRKTQSQKMDSKFKRRNKGTKNNFKCAQCNHCFAHKITLDAHVRKVHEGSKRPFQCDRCDKSYTFIGGLYTHIKEIHETVVRSYSCDYPGCERIYTSFIAMQKHKRLKHMENGSPKKYVCEQCGATFNQTGNLKHHRRNKHPTPAEQAEKEKCKERFECTICKKQFHSRYTLKYHTLQLHSDDMKYECNICGRRMAKKFMLVQHMLVHSTDKMPCEHCGKQFIRKFELEAHIRAVHMKLKPFACQYCSECFASRKTLRHHEYIHTGEKPYVCDICGQAYRQQTCLKNHRKAHEKLSTEAMLSANLNRSLMSSLMGPPQQPGTATDVLI